MWEGVRVGKKIPEKAEQSTVEGEQDRARTGNGQSRRHGKPGTTECLRLTGHVLGSLHTSVTWCSPLPGER